MALVLSLKYGEDFFVGDRRVTILQGNSYRKVAVETDEGHKFQLESERMQEIFDGVMVSVSPEANGGMARVIVEAPRTVPILRGDKYRSNMNVS